MTQLSLMKDKIDYRWTVASDTIRYINFKDKTQIISSEPRSLLSPYQSLAFQSLVCVLLH